MEKLMERYKRFTPVVHLGQVPRTAKYRKKGWHWRSIFLFAYLAFPTPSHFFFHAANSVGRTL